VSDGSGNFPNKSKKDGRDNGKDACPQEGDCSKSPMPEYGHGADVGVDEGFLR
jgi:hypothetical protein